MTPRQVATLAAEITLTALTVAVFVSLERLFIDTAYLGPVLVLAVASHVVATTTRRFGLGTGVSSLVSAAALILVFTSVLYPDTAAAIFPTSQTLDLLGNDLRDAWTIFTDQSAPAESATGFTATIGVTAWLVAFLADWAAFRLMSPIEAIAPATAIFVFGALMGLERNNLVHAMVFAGAVAAVLLAMRAERQVREETWAAAGSRQGISTTLRVGGASAAIAVLAGTLAGPLLPGSQSDAIVDFHEITSGAQSRTVVSPLVEISTSLIQQSNFEIFSVAVDESEKDYWRLMALNSFDGNVWRRSSSFDDVRGPVGSDIDPAVKRRPLTQTITTRRLGNIYLPAAYEVSNVVDSGGIDLEYERSTGALVVKQDDEKAAEAGFTYVIESLVPDFDPADLPAVATTGLDAEFVRENTALPRACGENESATSDECWPGSVTALAQQVTAGATTDHERAKMLQNFFLDPARFTYDLEVARHDNVDGVEQFLFEVRRGYCQQFSSTFAAMARSLGIPARVAVGFTWGEWDDTRNEYVVRGRNAHAWPEVYFAGAGWVAFDPTPGRARPHDSDITGLQEAQLGVNDGENRQVSATPTTAPITTRAPLSDGIDDDPDSGSGFTGLQTPTDTADDSSAIRSGGSSDGIPGWLAWLGWSTLLILAASLTVPAVRTVRRRRLIGRVKGDPLAAAELAFDDAVGALSLLDLTYEKHETPLEFEQRVRRSSPNSITGLHELVRSVTVLRYGQPHDPTSAAIDAREAAERVIRLCHTIAGREKVLVRFLDPRRLSPVG